MNLYSKSAAYHAADDHSFASSVVTSDDQKRVEIDDSEAQALIAQLMPSDVSPNKRAIIERLIIARLEQLALAQQAG